MVTLQAERLRTIEQLKAFVAGPAPVDCKPLDRESADDFVRRTLVAFNYHRLGKVDRGCVRRYVVKVTALSPAQLTRLVARHAETGAVVDLRARNSGRPFETRYGPIDIRLLAEIERGVRLDVGARDLRDTAPRVRGAPGSALRTAGGHFSFARLQPARVAHLPRQAHDVDEDRLLRGHTVHQGRPGRREDAV